MKPILFLLFLFFYEQSAAAGDACALDVPSVQHGLPMGCNATAVIKALDGYNCTINPSCGKVICRNVIPEDVFLFVNTTVCASESPATSPSAEPSSSSSPSPSPSPQEMDLAYYALTQDLQPTSTATGVTAQSVSPGNAGGGFEGSGSFSYYAAYPDATSLSASVTNNAYWSFTIAPAAGSTFCLTRLTFNVAKGGSSDPRGYGLYSSADGFTATLSSRTVTGLMDSPETHNAELNGVCVGSGGITFRFYCYVPTPYANSLDFQHLYVRGWFKG